MNLIRYEEIAGFPLECRHELAGGRGLQGRDDDSTVCGPSCQVTRKQIVLTPPGVAPASKEDAGVKVR